jgi:SulP family sulfate permease
LLRDFLAGLAVAMLLVPQSIAYASIVGLPGNYGVYAGDGKDEGVGVE